mgnify:CR=1 FL=1
MRLLSLEVANYRNITKAELTPGRELTVICGNNGQGKTNLLEAIWLLTGGKSFRGGKDAELVRRGEPFAVLEASTQRAQQPEELGSGEPDEPNHIRLTIGTPDSPRPGRTAAVNGAPPKRASSLAGSFPAVVFDPGRRRDAGSSWTPPSASSTPGIWPFTAAMSGRCSRKTRCSATPPPGGSGPMPKRRRCWRC